MFAKRRKPHKYSIFPRSEQKIKIVKDRLLEYTEEKRKTDLMKSRKNIYLYLIIIAALVYVGLLAILYCSEAASGDAAIRTFGDAFWYSLVTLSTVG